MVILIVLGLAGLTSTIFAVWACVQHVQINKSIQKDQHAYITAKGKILNDISIHLYKFNEHAKHNSNDEGSIKKGLHILQAIEAYIKSN